MRIATSSLLLLATLITLSGCDSMRGWQRLHPYYRVVVMDKRGDLIASWTADGEVKRQGGDFLLSDIGDEEYVFTAIERCIPNPPREFHYPLGWKVRVQAPKIVIYRTYEPAWHADLTPLDVAVEARAKGCKHAEVIEASDGKAVMRGK